MIFVLIDSIPVETLVHRTDRILDHIIPVQILVHAIDHIPVHILGHFPPPPPRCHISAHYFILLHRARHNHVVCVIDSEVIRGPEVDQKKNAVA